MILNMGNHEKYWFTSDLHLFHENVIKFDGRPFKNASIMGETIVNNFNALLKPDDVLFILGDVAMRCAVEDVVNVLNRINCKKVLVIGNHDRHFMSYKEFRDCFLYCVDYCTFTYQKTLFTLFHYPIGEHDQAFRGAIHLYGHVHTNTGKTTGKALNVGVMHHDYKPIHIDEVIKKTEHMSYKLPFGTKY